MKGEGGAKGGGQVGGQRTRASLRNHYTRRTQIKWRRGRKTGKS